MSERVPVVNLDGPLARQFRLRRVGFGPEWLVFCHGFATGQAAWDDVLSQLPPSYSALLFDLPGVSPERQDEFDPADCHSLAPFADDLLALLDEAGVTGCSFVGHSVAGMIGALAAIEDPERFHRLVSINTSPRYINDATYNGGFDLRQLGSLFDSMALDFQAWAAGFAAGVIPVDANDAVSRFVACLRAMRPDVAITIARVIFSIDMRPLLSNIRVPMVLIHSRDDPAVPPQVGEYLHRHIPGSRLVWIDAPGHLPQLSAPHAVADAIRAALA